MLTNSITDSDVVLVRMVAVLQSKWVSAIRNAHAGCVAATVFKQQMQCKRADLADYATRMHLFVGSSMLLPVADIFEQLLLILPCLHHRVHCVTHVVLHVQPDGPTVGAWYQLAVKYVLIETLLCACSCGTRGRR